MKKNNIIKIIILTIIFSITISRISFSQNSSYDLNVNIEWQSIDSYTPNFYEGRALAGEESYIKAIAIIDTNYVNKINTNALYYAWKYNDYYLYNYSGIGSKTIYFTLDKLLPVNTLILEIYTDETKNTLLGKKSIEIRPFSGFPILYKKNSNSILTYSNALNKKYEDLKVNEDGSFTIIAEPYFFSAKNTLDPSLNYSWTEDNVFSGENNSNIFKYFTGAVNKLNLKIKNNQKILQEGETFVNFSINK